MASIRKRAGKWQAQVRRKGFDPALRTFGKKADAIEWARRIEIQMDRNELEPDRRVLDQTTLGELIIRYRDEVVPAKRGCRDETIVLNAFLRHRICKRKLSRLSPEDFSEYRSERLLTVSSQTLKRQLTPIRTAIYVAMAEWQMPLRRNPLAGMKLSALDRRRERRVKDEERARLLEAVLKTRNPYVSPIITFALETAMRRGELLAMLWGHIDFERRSLVIPEAKNGHSRRIPLTRSAIGTLRKMGIGKGDEKVFPITPLAVRLAWTRLTARAGINDLHFHDLRHEAISRLFERGLTLPEVASISGHRDSRMLLRYAHADTNLVVAKLDATEGAIDALSASQPR